MWSVAVGHGDQSVGTPGHLADVKAGLEPHELARIPGRITHPHGGDHVPATAFQSPCIVATHCQHATIRRREDPQRLESRRKSGKRVAVPGHLLDETAITR
jgi:hypothetical protein